MMTVIIMIINEKHTVQTASKNCFIKAISLATRFGHRFIILPMATQVRARSLSSCKTEYAVTEEIIKQSK